MSRKGNCYDNSVMENFFGILKQEMYYGTTYYSFDELKEEIEQHPDIETVYIVDDSEDNYRALAAQLSVKNTYQLYRDYLDNFKINIERR